ncbi:NAD(P)/FAD-dependent oxidoreductase [Acinetobacter boissieri]|uniref:Tryptophan 2-monooxygenase n=1 Tax=Acinetobacter boissieri TaxID=1219383 RepID=A0A1G6JSH1_9GAMM|nr:NAD(P)/FAD-dependent oxidoreductase [Acinetobacter boissieri]SDC21375.1 Monoamine oxidase [Acinetobacter boissieri]
MQNNIDSTLPVFIIGAGIAGVACARKLQENGRKVIILEAKSSIGGRINSRKIDSDIFDLGASWIHGIDNNPIWSITQENNIETTTLNYGNSHYFHKNGKLFSEKEVQEFESYVEKIEKLLYQTKKTSALDAIKEIIFSLSYMGNTFSEDYLKKLLLSFFERIANDPFATELDLLSSKYQNYEGYFQGDEVIFPKGYYQVIECISKDINIKLNIDVKKIIYDDDYIKVIDCSENIYMGSHVVVTVPLGVLKRNNIEFYPPLPNEYIHSIQSIGFGSFNKVFFELDQSIQLGLKTLEKNISSFYWEDTDCFNILDLSKMYQKPTYLMLFGGDKSNFIDSSTDREVSDFIFNGLQKQFDGISDKPKKIIVTRWGADPYSYGSFSFPSLNHNDDLIKILHKPIKEILFFAGEHCSFKYAGTVHGAYLSGCEAAEKIKST